MEFKLLFSGMLLLLFGILCSAISNEENEKFKNKIFAGKASYYADNFEGRKTSNGERYYHEKLTAAHKTLPFGTKVKVTNKKNGKTVIVTINDRGPFIKNRHLDLSKEAMTQLDGVESGVIQVEYEIITNLETINSVGERKNEL